MKISTILYKFCLVFCAFWPNIVIARKTFKNAKFRQKSVKKMLFSNLSNVCTSIDAEFWDEFIYVQCLCILLQLFCIIRKKRYQKIRDRVWPDPRNLSHKSFFLTLIFETKFSKRIGLWKFSWKFYHFNSWNELDIDICLSKCMIRMSEMIWFHEIKKKFSRSLSFFT